MAKGINKVILVGNLGQDPETRYTQSGKAVTNISIATTDSWTDKQTGQRTDNTEWHRVVFFNRLAEIAGEYLRKGSQVYIEGSLRTHKWQDQQGQDRYTTEIVASEMQMLGGKQDGQGGQQNQQQQGGYAPQQQGGYGQNNGYQAPQQNYQQPQQHAPQNYQQPQHKPHQQSNSAPNRSAPAPGMDSFDDD